MTRPHPAPHAVRRPLAVLGALCLAAGLAVVAPVALTPVGAAPGTGNGAHGQSITVSDVDDLDPTGQTVEVTGEGFTEAAGFDVATAGVYLGVCLDNGPAVPPGPCVGGVDMTGHSPTSRWITNNPIGEAEVVPMAADGSFSTSFTAQAADAFVDCQDPPAGKDCKIFIRRDHRAGGDRNQDIRVPITWGAPAVPEASLSLTPATGLDPAGTDVVVTGSDFPTDGPGLYVVYGPPVTPTTDADTFGVAVFVAAAQIVGGSFTVTLEDVTAAYTDGHGADHSYLDGGGYVSTFRAHGAPDPGGRWSTSQPVRFEGATIPASTTTLAASATDATVGQPVVLTATVATTAGPVPSGSVEMRSGAAVLGVTDLDGTGRATLSTAFPSTGTRSVTAHFTGSASAAASTSAPVTIDVRATGPTTPPPTTEPPADVPSGTRTGTGPNGQTLTATPVDSLAPTGTEVSVEGRGFTPAAGFDIAADGLYVAVCVDNGPGAAPSPCVGGADAEGTHGNARWVTNNPYEGVPASALAPVAPDGSFRTTITVQAADEYVDCLALPAGESCVIAVRADHRSSADRSQDVKVPICFAGEAACATEEIPPADPGAAPAFAGFPIPPSGSGGAGGVSRLAATGSSAPGLAPWAIGLLAVGAVLVLTSQRIDRPRPTSPSPTPSDQEIP